MKQIEKEMWNTMVQINEHDVWQSTLLHQVLKERPIVAAACVGQHNKAVSNLGNHCRSTFRSCAKQSDGSYAVIPDKLVWYRKGKQVWYRRLC